MDSIQHIAVILDGNRRWAKNNNLSILEGHEEGANKVKLLCELTARAKIPYLTIYAFSKENWNRPSDQVDDLMSLLAGYIDNHLMEFVDKDIKIKIIGDKHSMPKDISERLNKVEEESSNGKLLNLNVALNYSARDEIIRAAGDIEKLYTFGTPDPDIIVRTGGEKRLSNFLLFQAAYSELIFLDSLWPDFNESEFNKIIEEYSSRQRRFGT